MRLPNIVVPRTSNVDPVHVLLTSPNVRPKHINRTYKNKPALVPYWSVIMTMYHDVRAKHGNANLVVKHKGVVIYQLPTVLETSSTPSGEVRATHIDDEPDEFAVSKLMKQTKAQLVAIIRTIGS